jgi:TnpA family transposase
LSEIQIAELFDPPTEQRELIRHYTLSPGDLAAIGRRRGDHNRLGHALMRCYLRYPGRPLRVGERPPAALLEFVADQIGVFPAAIDDYLATERVNRRAKVTPDRRPKGTPLSAGPGALLCAPES